MGKKRALQADVPSNSGLLESNRRCPVIVRRTGEQCKNWCIRGAKTCRFHGSGTQKSRIAAAKRIALASGVAAETLVQFMSDPTIEVKLRTQIAQDLLNRAGVSGKQLIEVEEPRWSQVLRDVLVDADDMAYDVALPGDNFDAIEMGVVDAEVVEDDEDRDHAIADHQRGRETARRKGAIVPYDRQNPRIPPSDSDEARDLHEAQKAQQRLMRDADRHPRNGKATMRRG